MLEVANERVEKLKKCGYSHAGVYNPPGVGGTHVRYVLHHADQPELYHNAVGFIATFAGLIYHCIGILVYCPQFAADLCPLSAASGLIYLRLPGFAEGQH